MIAMMKISRKFVAAFGFLAAVSTAAAANDESKQPKSAAALHAEVNALKKRDVAWREIQWKTCLLEGLKASREQKKPLMLWIFIDRPIDDERC